MIADMQFIMICSMISISIPGIGQRIQGVIVSFVMLDFLQADLWFTKYVSSQNSEALSPIFEANGYDSLNIFDNLGSTFLYGTLLVLLYVIYAILCAMKNCLDIKTE